MGGHAGAGGVVRRGLMGGGEPGGGGGLRSSVAVARHTGLWSAAERGSERDV